MRIRPVVVVLADRIAPGGPHEITLTRATCDALRGYVLGSFHRAAVELSCRTPGGGEIKGFIATTGCR